ncbi:MAG TPA: HAD-IIA family hydrolase [Nocardioides sp.]
MLEESSTALVEAHDLVMFDLDGVVYVGGRAVPGAAQAIARLRAAGVHPAFVTNNASRTPEEVGDRLRGLGVEAADGDVVTSAQAAAHLVRETWGGVRVLALGGRGLTAALAAEGLTVVPADVDVVQAGDVDVVASGFGPDVRWRHIMRAAALVADGVPYVASNADWTLPTESGLQPGHGVLVDTIARYAGVVPVVAGKPARHLLDETVRRVGGERPLMVGDRLDTDIEGARAAGAPSLLVLTGVTWLPELVVAGPEQRPTYLSVDLDGLFTPHPVPVSEGGTTRCGGWAVGVAGDRLVVTGDGDPDDWWRAVAVAAWDLLDRTGEPADTDGLHPPVARSAGARR